MTSERETTAGGREIGNSGVASATRRNGTTGRKASRNAVPGNRSEKTPSTSIDQSSTVSEPYVPNGDEIKAELWKIATGEGSEASRVSALRALADIVGISKTPAHEFPEGMTALLDALADGLRS